MEQTVKGLRSGATVEVCRSLPAFTRRLRKPLVWATTVIVILIMNGKELEEVLSLRSLLMDRRIILILPESSQDFLRLGLTLRPRYCCDPDRGFEDVLAVLEQMIRNHRG